MPKRRKRVDWWIVSWLLNWNIVYEDFFEFEESPGYVWELENSLSNKSDNLRWWVQYYT